MEERPQLNTLFIRFPIFVATNTMQATFLTPRPIQGYHAEDSRYAKMMSDMSSLHNSANDSFRLLPKPAVSVSQARDFFVTTATPFRGCDLADRALSAAIAWPRDVSVACIIRIVNDEVLVVG
jgi:hypothetical protein